MNKFSFFFVVAVWHVDFWFEALNFYENFGSDVKGSTFAMIMDVRGIFQVRLKRRHKELLRNLIGWRMASNVNHKWIRDLRPRGPRDNRRKPQRGDLFLCRRINSPRVAANDRIDWFILQNTKPHEFHYWKHRKEFISRENKATLVWFWVEIDNAPLNIPKMLRALSRGINETAPTPRIALFRCGVVRQRTGEERNECEVKKC